MASGKKSRKASQNRKKGNTPQKRQKTPAVRGTRRFEGDTPAPGRHYTNGQPPSRKKKVVSMAGRKRKRGTSRGGSEIAVLTISLVLFVISVGGSLYNFAARDQVATMTVPNGSVEIPDPISGIIIRDEKVYTSSTKGEVNFRVAENEKVRGGTVVCSIRNATTVAALEEEKEQLSKKILDMQSLRENVSAASADVQVINNRIKSDIEKNVYKFVGSQMSQLYTLKDSIESSMDYRNDLLLSESWGSVQADVDTHRQYSERISEITDSISIGEGGIVSYVIDGFEDILNSGNMESITKEQTQMKVTVETTKKVREVTEDDQAVFKVISNNDWYIASYIKNELIRDWTEGSNQIIHIERDNNYEQLEVKVSKINHGEKESFVLLQATKKIIDYLDLRTVTFKTHDSIYSGIKIPENAIVERTFLKIPNNYIYNIQNNTTVLKVVDGKTEQVYISTKYLRDVDPEESYVYVMQDFNNLKRGDMITTAGENPEEYVIDQIVTSSGVFKANNGTAVFVSINTELMVVSDTGYVILDSDSNRGFNGVNVQDRIVSDAANINIGEGDIIY